MPSCSLKTVSSCTPAMSGWSTPGFHHTRQALLMCCLSCVVIRPIDDAPLSRRSTVSTPNREASNIWALLALFPDTNRVGRWCGMRDCTIRVIQARGGRVSGEGFVIRMVLGLGDGAGGLLWELCLMVLHVRGVLPRLEQRLHESVYYMAERYYVMGVLLFCIFVIGQ